MSAATITTKIQEYANTHKAYTSGWDTIAESWTWDEIHDYIVENNLQTFGQTRANLQKFVTSYQEHADEVKSLPEEEW